MIDETTKTANKTKQIIIQQTLISLSCNLLFVPILGICPADNETDTINDYHIGQIKLTDTTSELFELVTADSELGEAWTVQTEPVVAYNSQQLQKQSIPTDIQTTSIASNSPLSTELSNTTILAQPHETHIPHEEPSNCTMAYLSYCVDIYKCEAACTALGASTYKWFHIGCCLCLGKPCYNLAGSVARCRNCPEEPYQTIDLENVDGSI